MIFLHDAYKEEKKEYTLIVAHALSFMKRSSARPQFDVFAIGDTMLDVFVQIRETAVHCELQSKACQISFTLGEKVAVDNVVKFPGAGNASNAAVGASRLGMCSGIYAVIGDDEAAKMIQARWKHEHVDATYVTQLKGHETNYSTVLTFQGERAILVYHQPYSYVFPQKLGDVQRLYYSSLGTEHAALERDILVYLAAHPKTKLTFQPGTHQLKRLAKNMHDVLKLTDILVMNKEEAELFLESSPKTSIKKHLARFLELGVRLAVITDGDQGSYAMNQEGAWKCACFPVPCIERTGAGDAYTTAFTWAIDRGYTVPQAMRYGTANAASVIQFLGPQDGLGSRETLERLIRKHSSIHPTSV